MVLQESTWRFRILQKILLHYVVKCNIYFFMNEGWLPRFKMQAIQVDKSHIETYTEEELNIALYHIMQKYLL